ALRDPADGGRELADVADAVLQEVAHPLGAVGEQVEGVLRLDVLREHEHGGAGMALADLAGRAQALVRVGGRHPDVHHRHVRAVRADLQEQLLGGARLPDHLEPGVREQARDPLAQEDGVLGDHDARHESGISATTRVPPPGGLSTSRRPSRTATRSARPRSPEPPPGSAPPTPSSATSTTTRPSGAATRTLAPVAPACLTTFASASETT